MRALPMIAATALLAGCQTYIPTQQAYREVRITSDTGFKRACLYLGREEVRVQGFKVANSASAAMKNRAAQRRGNLVVSEGAQVAAPGRSATMVGEVYAC